mmetsp:Transcript_19222/g.24942  ORF Transcript_19222/g.24942 Transcript_19222/m.24942 type:complete len:202 (-) Transcript_19222:17-622(-)
MTSIAELFPRAGRLKHEISLQLRQVESGSGDSSDCVMALAELDRQLTTLNNLLKKETPDKRTLWQIKLNELRYERNFLSNDLQKYIRARSTARERDRLFYRRTTHAVQSSDIDDLNAEQRSLDSSLSQINDDVELGRAALFDLAVQKERLKGAHRNALSIINTLGISSSLMRMLQSREKNDRYIVFSGMTITLFILYLCIR